MPPATQQEPVDNYRDRINAAIQQQLTGKTAVGDRIFTSLDRRLDPETDLPALMVYSQVAVRGRDDNGKSMIPRLVTVTIECATLAEPHQELTAVNAIVAQVEAVMDADRTLGQTVNACEWQMSISDVTSHGALPMGVAMIEYEVDIFTNQKADGWAELYDDGFTAPPTLVQTNPSVSGPAFQDWGTEQVGGNPPGVPGVPPRNPDMACGPNGCDLPAWGNEVQP